MKSLYFLVLVAAYLIYNAKKSGFSGDIAHGQLILAVVFILISAIYWLYDTFKGDRR